jgi:hypothetical protein
MIHKIRHFDLRPNEPVQLWSNGIKLDARFLFRDTLRACFTVGAEFREFELREDGDIEERPRGKGATEILGNGSTGVYNSAADVAEARRQRRRWTIAATR